MINRQLVSKSNVYTAIVLMTIAICFALFSYFTPLAYDDLSFKSLYLSYNGGNSYGGIKALMNFAAEIRNNDNGRLANILCGLATTVTPHWLFAVLSGITVAFMYFLMIRLAGVAPQNYPKIIVILWAVTLVLLPFRNNIIICDFLLNYVYASVFVLWFVLRVSKLNEGNSNFGKFIGTLLLGVIAAWFHEGFSASICFGFACYAVYRRFKLPWQWWIAVLLFGLVSIWVALAPGTLSRAGEEVNGHSLVEKIKISFTFLPAVCMMFGLIVYTIWRRKRSKIIQTVLMRPSIFVLAAAAIGGAIIVLAFNSDARAGWAPELFALIVLTACASALIPNFGKACTVICTILYVALCIFFVNVIVWQKRFYDQNAEIEARLSRSETGTIFYDIIDPREARLSTLFLTTRSQWISSSHFFALSDNPDLHCRLLSVVPTALSYVNLAEVKPLDGSGELYEVNDVLVGTPARYKNSDQGWRGDEAIYNFTTTDGSVYENQICFRRDFTAPNGKVYMYVRPLVPIEGKIERADFVSYY